MLIRILFKYLLVFIIYSVIFLLLLHSPLLSFQKVLFYRGMTFLIIAAILVALLLIIFQKKWHISWETLISSLLVSVFFHQAFFITFPVTFDRAFSMYLLNRLNNYPINNSCKGFPEKELEQKLINEYFVGQHALKKRLNEQSIIRFIDNKNDCITLSDRAKNFLLFSNIVKKLYNVR